MKVSNNYIDFHIFADRNQPLTEDYFYVYYLPEAANNKNINMVFISDVILVPFDEVELPPVMDAIIIEVDGSIHPYYRLNPGTFIPGSILPGRI